MRCATFEVRIGPGPAGDGVGPVCEALPIGPSACHDHPAKGDDPARLSDRIWRDIEPEPESPPVV